MDKKRLLQTLAVQSASGSNERVMDYIKQQLDKLKVPHFHDPKGNLYGTKGTVVEGEEFYPCVVAHTDTVHKIHEQFATFDVNGYIVAFSGPNQKGTGGDDKVGVFMALELLRHFNVMKVAFFVDEEIGCQGSRNSDKEFFNDVGYILQADRRGNEDIIHEISGKKLCSDEFKTAIKPQVDQYKRKWTSGATTDVGALADFHKISMMNMSCGYFLPHSDNEYVCVQDVENTFNFMKDVIGNLGATIYKCDHESTWKNNYHRHSVDYDYSEDYFTEGVKVSSLNLWVKQRHCHWDSNAPGGAGWVLDSNVDLTKLKKKTLTVTHRGSGTDTKGGTTNLLPPFDQEEREDDWDAYSEINGYYDAPGNGWRKDSYGNWERIKKQLSDPPKCPNCQHNTLMDYDSTAEDWFCGECMSYYEELIREIDDAAARMRATRGGDIDADIDDWIEAQRREVAMRKIDESNSSGLSYYYETIDGVQEYIKEEDNVARYKWVSGTPSRWELFELWNYIAKDYVSIYKKKKDNPATAVCLYPEVIDGVKFSIREEVKTARFKRKPLSEDEWELFEVWSPTKEAFVSLITKGKGVKTLPIKERKKIEKEAVSALPSHDCGGVFSWDLKTGLYTRFAKNQLWEWLPNIGKWCRAWDKSDDKDILPWERGGNYQEGDKCYVVRGNTKYIYECKVEKSEGGLAELKWKQVDDGTPITTAKVKQKVSKK